MSLLPERGLRIGSQRNSTQESKQRQIIESRPPWNWAFWSRAKQPASGPLSPTGESLSTLRERRNSPEYNLSRQNSSKGEQSKNPVDPAEKAEALLKPILDSLGPGALVEATVYTKEVETKIPRDADPKMVEKILEGAFGQFKEGKIFSQPYDGVGQLPRRSSDDKNTILEDRLVVRDFAQPDIHFPTQVGDALSKETSNLNKMESFNNGTYRIEESSDNEVPLLELPAWKTTEVRGDTMTMRTQYLSAKGLSKEKPTPSKETLRLKDIKRGLEKDDENELEIIKQRESKMKKDHEASIEAFKVQRLELIKNYDKKSAENLRMKDELRKKMVAIESYETKLQELQADLDRRHDDSAQLETYKREVELQQELRKELERQIAILSAPDPALKEVAENISMIVSRMQEERSRRGRAETQVRSLNRQVKSLTAKCNAAEAAVLALQNSTSNVPTADQEGATPSTSSTAKDDFEDYHLVIDNYLLSPTKREEWMEKEAILLREGAINIEKVFQLVDSYHALQKRYTDLERQLKEQDGQAEQSAPSDNDMLSVRALNQKCEALLIEMDELKKSREEMRLLIHKLKETQRAREEHVSSSHGSVLEDFLRQEESCREVEEAKVQVLIEQMKELQELHGKGDAMYRELKTMAPLQEQAISIGVFAMAQLIMLSYGFGAWLEMILIPLYGRFPT